MTDDSAKILFQSFPQEALVSSSSMCRDIHSLMLSAQRFLCWTWCCPPSKAQPWCISLWLTGLKAQTNQLITLQGTLKNGFGEAVMVCDMSDPGKFLSLDSCQKRFLWTKSCLCSTKYLSLLKWNQGKRNALHVTASRKSGIFTLPTPAPSTPTFWLPY